MIIRLLDVAGLQPALRAMRLPHESINDSKLTPILTPPNWESVLGEGDRKLALKLIRGGDEHGKFSRGILAWFEIEMPIYFMLEFDTYRIGIDCLSSSSSMHNECKGLYGGNLQAKKAKLGGGYTYIRVFVASYQALRRMYFQRKNHRLLEWGEFCNWIEELPLSELITTRR